MKMEHNGWSLPAAISRVVEKLRFYLGNSSDSSKFKGTMKMLDLLEEKLILLQDKNLQRVNTDREEEMGAWLLQVKEAADDAEELVKDMESGESAIPDVMTWFRSDSSNLLRMKYTIGRLVNVFTEGESLLGMPNLDEDVLESMWNDSASATPDHIYVVGRDKEMAMILDMVLEDAHFKVVEPLESWASADTLQISQKGWIIETLQNINPSQQRHEDAEVSPYPKEMGGTIEYTQVCNNTVSEMMNPMIIPVVGISGVGKTTLAQHIFNDKRIQKHFQGQSAWIYCTDNIRKEELMTKILVSLQPQHKILDLGFDLNSLHNQLQSFIEGKRFFIVLDDVSDDIHAVWGDVRSVLSRGAPGSVILVTTQLYGVASFMGTTAPIFLNPLQYDDLWKVFKNHAFFGNQSTEALESIGRKIAENLHGLPLAAVMVAVSLRNCLDEVHWNILLKSWWWSVSSNSLGIHIAASLGVCYCELPAYLRQCLVYCSIFPRNYIFVKYELIQMWIANGFVELCNTTGPKSLEDVAAEWFDELVNRCFLQPTFWELRYVMHDLVRDFAIALTSNEHRAVDCELVDLPRSVRHLSINMHNMNLSWEDYNIKNLRSLMLFGGLCDSSSSECYITADSLLERSYDTVDRLSEISYDNVDSISEGCSDAIDNEHADISFKRSCVAIGSIFRRSTSLRLLNLSNLRPNAATTCFDYHLLVEDHVAAFARFIARHHMLPHLTHLRYLDFSYSGITELPDSLCTLCNLQVLGLRSCKFTQLPGSMNSLISLRHLHADADTIALIHGIGGLTKLQDLQEFRVKAEDGHRITELRDMRYIEGSLCISDLQRVANQTEASQANLSRKEGIICLHLKWDTKQSLRGKYNHFGRELSQNAKVQKELLHASLFQRNYMASDISGSVVNPSEVSTPDQAIEILQCLTPPRNLQKLKIFGYPGCSFPDWVQCLRYIQVLEISHCIELQVLPPIGQLEHLKKLKSYELPSIKDVNSDVYGSSNVVSQSLEELTFGSMVKWENWADAENRELFPNLQKLQINRCHNLRGLPFIALSIAIKELSLSGCGSYSGTVSSYLHRLTCLTHLKVNDCSQKLILPCQKLVSLEYLHLSNCKEICFEGGILCLNNLKALHISSCHIVRLSLEEELTRLLSGWASMFGEEQALVLKTTILQIVKEAGMKSRDIHLPVSAVAGLSKKSGRNRRDTQHKQEHIHVMQSLTDLTMDNLSQSLNLDNILCKLSTLRTLCLHKIHNISVLQEQWLEQIKSLQELEFSSCYLLRKLPSNMAALSSLKKLSLQSCSQIHSLPSKGLPWNLKELQMLGCSPMLEARCQKEDGGIWVKKKIQEQQKQTINEYQQKKTNEFWQGWQEYEEQWVQCAGEQLRNKGEWLMNEEEDWLKQHSTVEPVSNVDVWLKATGEDWLKIAHIPYIRVNGDIIQNLYH
jgi:Leucine-rich repeat (LRR) protein